MIVSTLKLTNASAASAESTLTPEDSRVLDLIAEQIVNQEYSAADKTLSSHFKTPHYKKIRFGATLLVANSLVNQNASQRALNYTVELLKETNLTQSQKLQVLNIHLAALRQLGRFEEVSQLGMKELPDKVTHPELEIGVANEVLTALNELKMYRYVSHLGYRYLKKYTGACSTERARLYTQVVVALRQSKAYASALDHLEKILKLEIKDQELKNYLLSLKGRILFWNSVTHFQAEEHFYALECLEKAKSLRDPNAEMQKQMDEHRLQIAKQYKSYESCVFFLKSKKNYQDQKYKRALAYWARANMLKPKDELLRRNMQSLLTRIEYKYKDSPAFFLYMEAFTNFKNNRYLDALKSLQKAKKEKPSDGILNSAIEELSTKVKEAYRSFLTNQDQQSQSSKKKQASQTSS